MDLLGRSLKAQMKYADKFQVDYTVILGEAELQQGQACLRNMATSEQEMIDLDQVTTILLERLKK